MIDRVLDHLRVLVAADTTNPPRAITPVHPALSYAQGVLAAAGFAVEVEDLGDGSVCVLASRGTPEFVVNCHLDTVPPDAGWGGDPFTLRVEGDRAIGLGACDVKGSAACLLAAAERTTGDGAILLTTDEEAGAARCARRSAPILRERYGAVVVCEPTGLLAVSAHRGVVTGEVEFHGEGGHTSGAGGRRRSAVHDAVRWSAAALEDEPRVEALRFNIGRIEGGTKPNMVASRATVRFGLRPRTENEASLDWLHACLPFGSNSEWHTRFSAPALRAHPEAGAWIGRLGLTPGEAVNFWTEAAIYAGAGLPAIVFGPGEIAIAHAPGECVPLADLAGAVSVFARWFGG